MIRMGVLGYAGRMGKLVAEEIAAHPGCALAGGVVHTSKAELKKTKGVLISSNPDGVISISDVVIDFTTAEATAMNVNKAVARGKPFVSGVTGLSAETIEALQLAAKQIPVLYAPNTSLSLTAMKKIVTLTAELLADFDYDIAILDQHHRMKKDSPSGTALALGEAVLRGNGGKKKPAYTAVRAGHIVGEHEVIFAGQGETIRLQHSVTSRRIFARGAVEAAIWLHDKEPGFYGMDDVLKLKPIPESVERILKSV